MLNLKYEDSTPHHRATSALATPAPIEALPPTALPHHSHHRDTLRSSSSRTTRKALIIDRSVRRRSETRETHPHRLCADILNASTPSLGPPTRQSHLQLLPASANISSFKMVAKTCKGCWSISSWVIGWEAFGEICSRFLRWRSIYIHEVLCLEMMGWLDGDFQIQEQEGGEWLNGCLFPRWHVLVWWG
jgi:hypothetical protein